MELLLIVNLGLTLALWAHVAYNRRKVGQAERLLMRMADAVMPNNGPKEEGERWFCLRKDGICVTRYYLFGVRP